MALFLGQSNRSIFPQVHSILALGRVSVHWFLKRISHGRINRHSRNRRIFRLSHVVIVHDILASLCRYSTPAMIFLIGRAIFTRPAIATKPGIGRMIRHCAQANPYFATAVGVESAHHFRRRRIARPRRRLPIYAAFSSTASASAAAAISPGATGRIARLSPPVACLRLRNLSLWSVSCRSSLSTQASMQA